MKIDASRFVMFWSDPERYRLREVWRLAPIEPASDSFAALLTYGRRRGTCTHELRDGAIRGVSPEQSVQELRDGGFGDKEIEAAKRLSAAIPPDRILAHEVLFEYQIPESEHIMTGRIDSVIDRHDETLILDYKTSKHRSQADYRRKLEQYCAGSQVPFYLIGARTLGFTPTGFIYSLLCDGKNGVEVHEQRTERTSLQLKEFARSVAQTCDTIEFLKERYGVERAWPILPEPFTTGYEGILGSRQYDGYLPDGFEPKIDHLENMREEKSA